MAESSSLEHQSPHGELRTAFYNPYDIKRRRRTSRSQFKTLEKAFSENPKPNASTRQYLAQRLSMTPRGIQVWFQNRRAKNKQTGTAAHQADPCTSSSYSQRIENNIGQEEKSPFVDSTESRPSGVDFISNRHVSTLTIECSDNFSEPSTTKRVQATQADSMASNFPSSIQSNEPLALKTDMHPLYGSTNVNINANVNNNTIPTSNTEAWSPLQSWSGSVEQSGNSLANFQSLPQPFTFNSPPHSTFGPSAPESLDPPQNAAIPAISQENRPSITLHKSQVDSPKRRNSKSITFKELPIITSTAAIVREYPSTLNLTRRMSMPATIRIDNHKEGSQQLNLSTSDLQQSTLNQQPPLYSPNNNTTIKNIAQSLPLHALLPPQPQPSRAERSEVTPTVTTTAAANANVDRTPLIPDTFGYIMSQGDTRGHAFTYPLSRRVSIHETSISSAQNRPKHKVVHALDGLNSSSPSVEIDQIGSRSTQIEVQSKRRKSVSKHFRSSEELSVAGVQMFESMGGITQGDTPSFSESPTSVNVPSFMFSPPGQQPRITDNKVIGQNSTHSKSQTITESREMTAPIASVMWMDGIDSIQQTPLEGSWMNTSTTSGNGGNIDLNSLPSTLQQSSPVITLPGRSLSNRPSQLLMGQNALPSQSFIFTGDEASSFEPLDLRKGHRRSSIKATSRNKSQSGTRVQFDIQQLSMGNSALDTSRQGSSTQSTQPRNYETNKVENKDVTLDTTSSQQLPLLVIPTADIVVSSSISHFDAMARKHSSSPPPFPNISDHLKPTIHHSVSQLPLPIDAGLTDRGSSIYWPLTIELGQDKHSGQSSPIMDSSVLQDSPQTRRNSCPPELIEGFKKGLQIIPDNIAANNRLHLNQGESNSLQLQQQSNYCLQLQPQQPFFQYQHNLHYPELQLRFFQQQHHQQHQHYQSPFFMSIQEFQSVSTGPPSTSENNKPKVDTNSLTQNDNFSGTILFENRAIEHHEQDVSVPISTKPTLDQEIKVSNLNSQEIKRAQSLALRHRHSLTDPYHLPQLQTPRLLAQQQHQIEQPPWSRTQGTHGTRSALSHHTIQAVTQDTLGRRYSEPCNTSKNLSCEISQQDTAILDEHELNPSIANSDSFQWTPSKEASLEGRTSSESPNLFAKTESLPFSRPLHPLDVSASDSTDADQSNMLLPAYAPNSHITTTPAHGQQMLIYPISTDLTSSPASSISSSSSPSSSPLTNRNIRELSFVNAATISPMSNSRPTTFRGPSPPVWATPTSVAMAISSVEAPLLVRTLSLDPMLLQQNSMRENSNILEGPNASSFAPSRRHSQGPSLSELSEHGSRVNPMLQQQQLSILPSFSPPSSALPLSPISSKSVHPFDQNNQQSQQQHFQQQQEQQEHLLQQDQNWNSVFPTIFPSPQPISSHAIHSSQQDRKLNQESSTDTMFHNESKGHINWEQGLAEIDRFAILQQKSPFPIQQHLNQRVHDPHLLSHSQVHSIDQPLDPQQIYPLHSLHHHHHHHQQQQRQQQQQQQQQKQSFEHQDQDQHSSNMQTSLQTLTYLQPQPIQVQQTSLLTLTKSEEKPTISSFKDAKAFEDYKHQQFILEHQRLQREQELDASLESQDKVKLELSIVENQNNIVDRNGSTLTHITTTTDQLSGQVSIATAIIP